VPLRHEIPGMLSGVALVKGLSMRIVGVVGWERGKVFGFAYVDVELVLAEVLRMV